MYYQNYEDYMRSVLGYPAVYENQSTYDTSQYNTVYAKQIRYSSDIMELYPEIYKIANPMVCKLCSTNTKPITRELLEQMTDEIYFNLESQPEIDTVINVKVNTSVPVDKNNRTATTSSKTKIEENRVENREDRQRRPNNTLRDLIRILILNQLLGESGVFPPGRPPRPRPPRPPMRPPFPRNEEYYDEYFNF